MERLLKVGVISCSGMAAAHMLAVSGHANARLEAICDIDAQKAAQAAKTFGVQNVYLDYRQLLENGDIDTVIVCTPDQLHREMTVAALEAGKNVLCEKPMALTMEDCGAMVRAARKSDRKMMGGHIGRYTPGFYKAKELIDRGEIGELFFIETEYAHDYSKIAGAGSWRLDPMRHGFLGGGCHAVDLARWIAGNPTEVMAYANRKMLRDWPTDDCTVAIMKFPDDVIGKVFVSTGCKRNYTMRSVFYGSKGTIITDNTSSAMTVFKDGVGAGDSLFEGISQTFAVPIQYPISVSNHNTVGEFEDFADIILNDKEVRMSAYEGACTVSVCLSAVEAAKRGVPVAPDYNF